VHSKEYALEFLFDAKTQKLIKMTCDLEIFGNLMNQIYDLKFILNKLPPTSRGIFDSDSNYIVSWPNGTSISFPVDKQHMKGDGHPMSADYIPNAKLSSFCSSTLSKDEPPTPFLRFSKPGFVEIKSEIFEIGWSKPVDVLSILGEPDKTSPRHVTDRPAFVSHVWQYQNYGVLFVFSQTSFILERIIACNNLPLCRENFGEFSRCFFELKLTTAVTINNESKIPSDFKKLFKDQPIVLSNEEDSLLLFELKEYGISFEVLEQSISCIQFTLPLSS
jgi:hypothetical protein